MFPTELYHHGILGQKHGKRNAAHYPLNQEDFSAEELAAGARESSWAQESDEGPEKKPTVKNKEYYKSKKASDLSDEEINAAIRRIQIEDQYDRMTGQNQPVQEKEHYVGQLVKKFAKQTAETFASQAAGKIGQNLASAMLDQAINNMKKKREREEARQKELAEAKKEQRMIKTIEKKMGKKGDASKLSGKELDFYNKRYEQEEKVNKIFGIDESGTKKKEHDANIMDTVNTIMNTKSKKKYEDAIRNIQPDDVNTVKNIINNLSNIKDKTNGTKKDPRNFVDYKQGPKISRSGQYFDIDTDNREIANLKRLYDKRYNR